jgi:hypothetical protein
VGLRLAMIFLMGDVYESRNRDVWII